MEHENFNFSEKIYQPLTNFKQNFNPQFNSPATSQKQKYFVEFLGHSFKM